MVQKIAALFVLGLLVASGALAQEYRFGVAPGVEAIRRNERLSEVEKSVTSYREGGRKVISSVTDFHTVTDVSIDQIVSVFTDRENQVGTIPRLVFYEWEYIPGTNEQKYYEEQILSIKFMSFESSYHNYLLAEITDNRDQSPPSYSIQWVLLDSLDDRMKRNEGNYYLTEVEHKGETKTYMRQYIHSELTDTFVGMEFGLRSFIANDTQALFSAIFDAARER